MLLKKLIFCGKTSIDTHVKMLLKKKKNKKKKKNTKINPIFAVHDMSCFFACYGIICIQDLLRSKLSYSPMVSLMGDIFFTYWNLLC